MISLKLLVIILYILFLIRGLNLAYVGTKYQDPMPQGLGLIMITGLILFGLPCILTIWPYF